MIKLVRVKSNYFTAGFETDGERVTRCAPILAKLIMGKTEAEARDLIAARSWKASVVSEIDPDEIEWPNGHEFITVLKRRWCLGCDLYQTRAAGGRFPAPAQPCDRSGPRERAIDAQLQGRDRPVPKMGDPR